MAHRTLYQLPIKKKQLSDNLMTYEEAAEFLRYSKPTLYNLVSGNKIPYIRLSGKSVRFVKGQLIEWLQDKPNRRV